MGIQVLIGIAIILITLLFLRELFTWYWKLTNIANSLERIEEILENIQKSLATLNKAHREEEVKDN